METEPIRRPLLPRAPAQEEERLAIRFQRGFLAGKRLGALPWEDLEKTLRTSGDSSTVLSILQKTVFHPLCLKYPLSVKYRKCFLTELIKKHESTGAEPLDPLYEALGNVLTTEEKTHCYKSYLLPAGDAVTLCESLAIISQGTTGLVTWDAGLLLAEWALQNPSVFCNRNVLELGSGIGLTGIVVCKVCRPKAYTFSDHHPCVLQQLSENICLNGLLPASEACSRSPANSNSQESDAARITVAEIDWDQVTKEWLAALGPDVVIAADVVYDPALIQSLVGVLQKLPTGTHGGKAPEVYIAFMIRNPETYRCFQTELAQAGIAWRTVPSPQMNLFSYDQHANIYLPLCGSHVVHHDLCEVPAVLQLVCPDMSLGGHARGVATQIVPVILALFSCHRTTIAILRAASADGQQKAFSTCSAHRTAVSVFYTTAVLMYLCSKEKRTAEQDKAISVFCPIVHSLRNQVLRGALWRFLGQMASANA